MARYVPFSLGLQCRRRRRFRRHARREPRFHPFIEDGIDSAFVRLHAIGLVTQRHRDLPRDISELLLLFEGRVRVRRQRLDTGVGACSTAELLPIAARDVLTRRLRRLGCRELLPVLSQHAAAPPLNVRCRAVPSACCCRLTTAARVACRGGCGNSARSGAPARPCTLRARSTRAAIDSDLRRARRCQVRWSCWRGRRRGVDRGGWRLRCEWRRPMRRPRRGGARRQGLVCVLICKGVERRHGRRGRVAASGPQAHHVQLLVGRYGGRRCWIIGGRS